MESQNCWVWFKGSINEVGVWKGGFQCKKDEKPGFIIESPSYVTCRVPNWRVKNSEPENINIGPEIPEGAVWKLF